MSTAYYYFYFYFLSLNNHIIARFKLKTVSHFFNLYKMYVLILICWKLSLIMTYELSFV